jgi:hypothetical protein
MWEVCSTVWCTTEDEPKLSSCEFCLRLSAGRELRREWLIVSGCESKDGSRMPPSGPRLGVGSEFWKRE